MTNNLPDFYIVGAPKCGTTTIYNWLRQHPAVYMPELKEPSFFCGFKKDWKGPMADHLRKIVVSSFDEYKSLFNDAPENAKKGEATVHYLHSQEAVTNIKKATPNARIIIVLRNPVHRAFSEHMHMIRDGHEDKTFMESLALEEKRRTENWFPSFFHIQRSLYFTAVSRYLDAFGRENVQIHIFETLRESPETVFNSVLDFIDVPRIPIRIYR